MQIGVQVDEQPLAAGDAEAQRHQRGAKNARRNRRRVTRHQEPPERADEQRAGQRQRPHAAQRHEIQFWKRALYPFACLVMMALALPFAYLHARAGGVSYKVFGGIMLGISFVLLNNASGHLGLLRQWTPWMAAAAPSGLYLLISMGAFAWLVRFR